MTTLLPVIWDGLALNTGGPDPATGLILVVEDIAGWKDSPPLNGNDIDRALSDGSAYGPKLLQARQVIIQGAVITADDPADLPPFRDKLAGKAAARQPAVLQVGDLAGRTLTATVRADSDAFKWTFLSQTAFRWQVTLMAADPRLYDAAVQSVKLSNAAGGSGWTYSRVYPRSYGASAPNSAVLANGGNAAAPVTALYTGDLAAGNRLTDGTNSIFLAALAAGEQVYVQTDRLVAYAPGGASRQSYILPGSAPMSVPPGGATWTLLGTGGGNVQLAWQGAWT
jgi:hypothetical protein